MQRIIMAVVVLAAVGAVSAFAASELVPSHRAGAAPTAQQVREQNLDGSGFIRTHEQGTASVNVTNGSLPVSGTVNVGNFPAAAQGRLINLSFTNDLSQFADVSGCANVSILARATATDFNVGLFSSPDGTTRILPGDSGATHGTADGFRTALAKNLLVAEPFLQLEIQAPSPTAWIWCEP